MGTIVSVSTAAAQINPAPSANHTIPNAQDLEDSCEDSQKDSIITVSIPLSEFRFQFKKTNGITRSTFIFTLHCDMLLTTDERLKTARNKFSRLENGFAIYSVGVGEEFYLNRNDSSYYFCDEKLPFDENFRGCSVDLYIYPSSPPRATASLVATYGIDYLNRQNILLINNDIQRYIRSNSFN